MHKQTSAVRQIARVRARVRNWSLIVIALIVLLLVWQVAGALAPAPIVYDGEQVYENESVARAARIFNTVSTVGMWLFLIVLLPTIGVAGLQALGWLARNFGSVFEFGVDEAVEETSEAEQEQAKQELGPVVMRHVDTIGINMETIGRRIEVLHARRSKAAVELEAIKPLASTLVRLIQGVAGKMKALKQERDRLEKLQTALDEGDERTIAWVAAQVGDGAIVSLANDPNRRVYQERFQQMISAEAGSIDRQLTLLQGLGQDWISHLLDFRVRMDELSTLIDSAEALPLIVEIQGRLTSATETLGINETQLQGMMASRTLPRIHIEPARMAQEYAPALESESGR